MQTNTTTLPSTTLTMDSLLEIIRIIKPEPFGEYMRSQGFSPKTHVMILPYSYKQEDTIYPDYVRFHWLADDHTYIFPFNWFALPKPIIPDKYKKTCA